MIAQTKSPDLGKSQGHALHITTERVKPNTQQGMVLELLRQQPMSAAELQWRLPVADARAVVRSLRGKGYRIEGALHPRPQGRPVQRYHLIEAH